MIRYLTKSRFKLALECPTKLFYTKKESVYADQKQADPFLEALAEGGFQVGELAKCYYPSGHSIVTLDYDIALKETNELLKLENVIIFEAAFKFNNLFIRADIIEKKGNNIKLIEVKSKSFDGDEDNVFIGKRTQNLKPGWLPYLFDVAFQKYVINKAKPEYNVTAYLMLANKQQEATVDGLNQKFRLEKIEDRTQCNVTGDVTPDALGVEILIPENVDEIVTNIHNSIYTAPFQEGKFHEWIATLAHAYEHDVKIEKPVHKGCGDCQFKCSIEDENKGLKSGFKECWEKQTPLKGNDFEKPLIFELWKGSLGSKDIITQLMSDNIFFLKDILESYYAPKNTGESICLSPTERRNLQVNKLKNNDSTPYLDTKGLKEEMASWKYPLHFIDFETSAVAIPFNKGLRPYEGVAFQFSHHQVEADGTVSHKGQYLNIEPGKFPNFDFIRALKKELENDEGTIFRYAAHENSYLNMIYQQLHSSCGFNDRDELMDFIKSITKSTGGNAEQWEGNRCMVDMLKVVKDYYYHPIMKGSNSIKVVLPAALNSSNYLQQKYSQPIYGKGKQINSLNFDEQVWIKWNGNVVENPYKLLPNVFENYNGDELDKLVTNDKLADGGAAMTAYAKMQFTDMSDTERHAIAKALLKYCELDTLAMVMIYEYWREEIN
jgi:hypothetical protein